MLNDSLKVMTMVSRLNTNMCCPSYDAVIPAGLIFGEFDDDLLISPAIASPSPSPSPPPPHHHHHSPVPETGSSLLLSSPQETTLLDDPAVNDSDDDVIASSNGKRKRKGVRFHEARVVSLLVPGSEMSQTERNVLWYHTSELDAFKTQARNQCRQMRVTCAIECVSPFQQQHLYEESCRGLEHRICLERQKNKVLAIRCTLKAQSRFNHNADDIALVAVKCTAWAKEVAMVEASRDFCDVYHPHLSSVIQDVASPTSNFPLPFRRSGERSISSSNSSNNNPTSNCSSRNKRQSSHHQNQGDFGGCDDMDESRKRRRVCGDNSVATAATTTTTNDDSQQQQGESSSSSPLPRHFCF